MLKGRRLAFDRLSHEGGQGALTNSQRLFVDEFMGAARRLFKLMEVPVDACLAYRLYDWEVVELNREVSVLVLVPPAESSCAVPGQKELLLQRADLISISVQSFEMNHLRTYQSRVIEKYSRLSCILELETVFAAHSQREAFSQAEVQVAKERVQKLQDLSQGLNAVWKGVRWVMDVIGFARDRTPACSHVTMEGLTQIWRQCGGGAGTGHQGRIRSSGASTQQQRHLLELPSSSGSAVSSGGVSTNEGSGGNGGQEKQKQPMKTSPGRGSWPGPTVSDHLFLSDQEHSRSEQQLIKGSNLGLGGSQQYLGIGGSGGSGLMSMFGGKGSRKNSADSNVSEAMSCSSAKTVPYHQQKQGSIDGGRMQSSRSEDTLNVCRDGSSGAGRKRTTTSSCTRLGRDEQDQQKENEGAEENENDQGRRPRGDKSQGAGFAVPRPVSLHGAHSSSSGSKKVVTEDKKKKSGDMSEFSTIQVYAAYETGLTNGTSLKLHVTTETTTREVVDLVVKQLNMAVLLKGKEGPIYGEQDLREFCLVAIIGARERCLRDDFRPLQLQNPWRKGRLYVRKKMDVLAALEHNNQAKMI